MEINPLVSGWLQVCRQGRVGVEAGAGAEVEAGEEADICAGQR